jgi:hypothetical protein
MILELNNMRGNLLDAVINLKDNVDIYKKDIINPAYDIIIVHIHDIKFKNCNFKITNSKYIMRDPKFGSYVVNSFILFSNCIIDSSKFDNQSDFIIKISGITDFHLYTGSKCPFSVLSENGYSAVDNKVVDRCIIRNSTLHRFVNINVNIDDLLNKKYKGQYGWKLVLAKTYNYSKKTNIKYQNPMLVPVLLKLRIPKDATTVIPTFQSNSTTKMRSNKVIVDSVYMISIKHSNIFKLFQNKNISDIKLIELNKQDIVKLNSKYRKYNTIMEFDRLFSPYYTSDIPMLTGFNKKGIQEKNIEDVCYIIGNESSVLKFEVSHVECAPGIHFFSTKKDAILFYISYLYSIGLNLSITPGIVDFSIQRDKKILDLGKYCHTAHMGTYL